MHPSCQGMPLLAPYPGIITDDKTTGCECEEPGAIITGGGLGLGVLQPNGFPPVGTM